MLISGLFYLGLNSDYNFSNNYYANHPCSSAARLNQLILITLMLSV